MAAAKALGAKRIIAVDVQQERLDFAAKYAATDVHLASPPYPGEARTDYSKRHADILKEKYGLTERGPAGIDYIFECTGAEVCVQTALWLLKRRGVYVQVGHPLLRELLGKVEVLRTGRQSPYYQLGGAVAYHWRARA